MTPEGFSIPLEEIGAAEAGIETGQNLSDIKLAKAETKLKNGVNESSTLTREAHLRCQNIHEVFTKSEFGQKLKMCVEHVKGRYYHGEKIFRITKKINHPWLKEGDLVYFDSAHDFQLEVYNGNETAKCVLYLDGAINEIETAKVLSEHRKISIR